MVVHDEEEDMSGSNVMQMAQVVPDNVSDCGSSYALFTPDSERV